MTDTPPPLTVRTLWVAHRGRLAGATALVSLAALLELVPHVVVYFAAVEVFSEVPSTDPLVGLALAAFGGVVLRFVLLGAGYILSHGVAFSVMRSLRRALTRKLLRVPTRFFATHPVGDLKKTLVDDIASLEGVFAHNLPELASGIFVPLVAGGILFAVDLRLGLASLVVLPVAFAVQALTMSGYGAAYQEWHEAESRANASILEFIRGIVVLKAYNRDASSLANVRGSVVALRDLADAMTRRSMVGYAVFFGLLQGNLVVVLPVGLLLFFWGDLRPEQLVLFVALGMGMLVPLMNLLFLFGNLQKTQTAWARIRAVWVAEELEAVDGLAPLSEAPVVRFDAVSFTYPGRQEPALRDVSFTLEPGTVTAVVGPSGAGKSTLARLLVRDYDVDEGTITLDGVDLRQVPSGQRMALLGHVAQHTTLFDGTVAENLRLADPSATDEALEQAARAAQAHAFLLALPQGYATPLGDRGSRLSGGERQRLSIARALLKRSAWVVLDEVTANVDPESERGIQAGLSALAEHRGVLVVAHRLRTVVGVDRILVVEGGRLIAQGRHEELLAGCAVYAQLWNDQEAAGQWALGGAA